MLKNYYLIAGAGWSILNKGDKVVVLQQLPTGYYLVKATRNTIVNLSMTDIKRNISDSAIVRQSSTTTSGDFSEPTSPSNIYSNSPPVSIMVHQSSDSNLVPSDSFQSNISDDSGIVESSKRASNLSTKEEDEDKSPSETTGVHLENGSGELEAEFEVTFKAHSTTSLPVNFSHSKHNGKLPIHPTSTRMSYSVSFSTVTEYSDDQISLPLIGSVPPSVLDCYADQMFSPTFVKPHSSNLVLQPPLAKSPAFNGKKKKSTSKGNRLSLQVENYVSEDNKYKSNTLPLHGAKSSSPVGHHKSKRAFKNFFKKRLSTHGKLPSISSEGDSDKEFLSIHEDSLPPELDRMQSPVCGMNCVVPFLL